MQYSGIIPVWKKTISTKPLILMAWCFCTKASVATENAPIRFQLFMGWCIEAGTKWPTYNRRHFQMHFSLFLFLSLDENFTAACSRRTSWLPEIRIGFHKAPCIDIFNNSGHVFTRAVWQLNPDNNDAYLFPTCISAISVPVGWCSWPH